MLSTPLIPVITTLILILWTAAMKLPAGILKVPAKKKPISKTLSAGIEPLYLSVNKILTTKGASTYKQAVIEKLISASFFKTEIYLLLSACSFSGHDFIHRQI